MLTALYPISKGKDASLRRDIEVAINEFCDKRGYKPQFVIVRHYQTDDAKDLDIEIKSTLGGVQPGHFMLGPVKERYECCNTS